MLLVMLYFGLVSSVACILELVTSGSAVLTKLVAGRLLLSSELGRIDCVLVVSLCRTM
ncbi:hypothetical protein BDY19DRAFT_964878 [Irpex rosettiformis]|uniref:Uncharacterized protein n=1 Tax=Irpex rosettiformis TaxID=378272 RepID=A0ACB8TU93_9APHY|nr:hypothetical protein BDY19DRAFT_964878 [Irpex rosettiformis]